MKKKILSELAGALLVLMIVAVMGSSGILFPLFIFIVVMILNKSGSVNSSVQHKRKFSQDHSEWIREKNLARLGAYGEARKLRYGG